MKKTYNWNTAKGAKIELTVKINQKWEVIL